MGYQFIHVEGYGLQGAKTNQNGRTSTIREILAEAMREPGNTPHIEKPQPPTLIFGSTDNIEKLAEEFAEQSTDQLGRKMRKDALIMLAGVASLPRDQDEDFEEFKKKTLEYLKTKYGERLQCVIGHNDEAHPHVHFYALPSVGEKFEDIHEGFKASRKAYRDKQKKGVQNLAYINAMRRFQDDYSEKLGMQFGLTRLGPGRRRLSTKAWKAEQQQAEFFADAKAVAEHGHKKGYKKGLEKAKRENEKIGEKFGAFVAGALGTLHKPTTTAEAEIKQLKTEAEEAAKKHDHDRRQAESKARSEKAAVAEKLAKKTREVEALEADLKTAEQATAKAYELATFYEKKVKSSLVGGAKI